MFLAATLVGWIGDFVYRKVAAKNIFYFADINVSLGSVAKYARCGGIFNTHLTANLLRNLLVNFF